MRSFSVHSSIGACATIVVVALGASCRPSPQPPTGTIEASHDSGAGASSSSATSASVAMGADGGDVVDPVATDPMALHRETRDELLSLFEMRSFTDEEKKRINPDGFLRNIVGEGGPGRMSQGNKAIASHLVTKETCLDGLKAAGITVQTAEQRAKCGAENMVPIWIKGKEPWFCIDVFEFPNKACELPFVWTPPTWSRKVCELQGKRLCSDIEWNIACRGDPEGGEDWRYAYGPKLDLTACNDAKGHIRQCYVLDAKTTWNTCATETEPSGAFPRCRSRFGVFDQHGNVAEVMMRREGDQVLSQLKGSAWFYNELAKEPGSPIPETTKNKQGAHPDHCNFDPRWHVEPIDNAQHVNYHLGFRCCKSIP